MAPRRWPLLALALLLAGCLQTTAPMDVPDVPASTEVVSHVLVGTKAPAELVAPAFKLVGAIAKGGPVYGAGEPNIWAHLDGTLLVAFAGCDNGPYYLVPGGVPGQAPCAHGPVYRSSDKGATWKRLNARDSGRLAPDGPAANGDNDVAVDANGTIYVSNLGAGIHVQKSVDSGATWTYVGNVVPRTNPGAPTPAYNSDRNWMAAAGPGHLIVAWMGSAPAAQGAASPAPRAVGINTTFDGGETWTGATYISRSIGWLGSVQFAPDGKTAYIPFTKGGPAPTSPGPREFELRVARTLDGGRTWEDLDTGLRTRASSQGGHWSGVLMAPSLDVTGDGTLVYAWSEEVLDAAGLTATGSRVRYATSGDQGTTWKVGPTVSGGAQGIMPWVTGGAGDRFAIVYLSSDVPGDSDYVPGMWRLQVLVADGENGARRTIDPEVHLGNICTRGGGCQHPVSDRELLDFFEADLTPDGHLVVTYPADDVRGGKSIEIRVAIQDGGTPLLVRDA